MSYDKKARQDANAFAYQYECIAKLLLEAKGHTVEMTPHNHAYDLLVDGVLRVEVKASKLVKVKDNWRYAYYLGKKAKTCDVFMFFAVDEKENYPSVYCIPKQSIEDSKHINMGRKSKKYGKYLGNLGIIKNMVWMKNKLSA